MAKKNVMGFKHLFYKENISQKGGLNGDEVCNGVKT